MAEANIECPVGESERELVELVGRLPIAFFRFDRNLKCKYASPAMQRLTGTASASAACEDMPGGGFYLAPGVWTEFRALCRRVLASGEAARFHFRLDTATGRRQFESSVYAERDATGAVIGVAGFTTDAQEIDLTELKNAVAEREQLLEAERIARTQAEAVGRIKDEFLATLAHELRTPLNAVLGWTEVLRRRTGNAPDLAKGLDTISRNARAQAQIIGELLDMSQIISGKVRLNLQVVLLHEITAAAVDAVRPNAEQKGLGLQCLLDGGICRVKADPARLQQVLGNLLTNAIKFTPAGGRISVTLARVKSHVELSVADTGIGIDARFLPHVFDRFRQADAASTRRHGGLGIGLSIVRRLVEMHGGAARVESAGVGQGSTFVISLPVAMADSTAGAHELIPSTEDAPELPRLDGVTAVIVDDEADARALVARILEERGARAIAVESACEALRALGREPADVLISDIGMADMDGYDLIKALRARPAEQGGQIPAIAVTAYARDEDRHRSLLAGYQVYIRKPIELRELVMAAATLIERVPRAAQRTHEQTDRPEGRSDASAQAAERPAQRS